MQDPSLAQDENYRAIKLHGPLDFQGMRLAGRLAAETLDYLTPYVKPGITTEELSATAFPDPGSWKTAIS